MANKKTVQTKKPTGLSIARNGMNFVFSWKQGEKYDEKQILEYRIHTLESGWKKWTSLSVGVTATSKTLKLAYTSYWPYNKNVHLCAVQFRVKGNCKDTKDKKKTASDYTSSSALWIDIPNKPSVSFSLSSEKENEGTGSWSIEVSENDNRPVNFYVYRVATAYDWTGNLNAVAWSGDIACETSGSVELNNVGSSANKSVTRLIAVQAKGVRGDSEWAYAWHTYATPLAAEIKDAWAEQGAGKTHCTLSWTQAAPAHKPVDSMEIMYISGVPGNGMEPPSGASPTAVGTVGRISSSMNYDFYINSALDYDECVWLQIKTNHDKNYNISNTVIANVGVKGYAGRLSTPTFRGSAEDTSLTISVDQNTEVRDSFTIVSISFKDDPNNWYNVGILPYNANGTAEDIFQCPDVAGRDYTIKVCNYVGEYTETEEEWGVNYNVINTVMSSEVVKSDSGEMPLPPSDISIVQISSSSVKLSWDWKWKLANEVTISWSDHPDAWESTDGPEEYEINHKATSWIVAKLDSDKDYYFRIRLRNTNGDTEVVSDWSKTKQIRISSELVKPHIWTEQDLYNINDVITFTCSYSSNEDVFVHIGEIIDGVVSEKYIFSKSQRSVVSMSVSDINKELLSNGAEPWQTGSRHYVACRIGDTEWSEPIIIDIIPAVEIGEIVHNLVVNTLIDEDGEERQILSLNAFPINVSVTGAGDQGRTKAYIIRESNYIISRPTEKNEERYSGEIVAAMTSEGEDEISINYSNIIGNLDEGASYELTVQIEDVYGQTAVASVPFEVHWTHQPEIPVADVVTDVDRKVTIISVSQPEGYETGDTFDVYRLSIDYPELILKDCEYGVRYVDPYPAFGPYGGHRIVNRTINGDYITSDNLLAWTDTGEDEGDFLDYKKAVIEFDGKQIELEYNLDLSNSWKKDFKQTVYLGGSITGDWNPGVIRSLSLDTVHLNVLDDNVIEDIRKLAVYAGVCHIRTPDGSSFACDIQVSEKKSHENKFRNDYSLSISRVDSQTLEGMTYEEWRELYGLE